MSEFCLQLDVEDPTRFEVDPLPLDGPSLFPEVTAPPIELMLCQQGPPGPPGDSISLPSAIAASGHRVMSAQADGTLAYADQTNPELMAVAGFTTSAVEAGGLTVLKSTGLLDWPAANLTPWAPLFLGVDGMVTETAPVTGWSKRVATAVAVDRIFIHLEQAYWLG